MREKQSYKTKYRGKILYISSKNKKIEDIFQGCLRFLDSKETNGSAPEQYPHLIGFFAIDEEQSAAKTLDDLVSGQGDYQNIMVANKGATFSKIQVLPDFKAVIDSNSFIFDDLSDVERMHRLDLGKAIRTEDKDVLIAFRNVDGEYLPASLMKVTNKLESELSMANNKDVLGIIGEKDGEFKILSVNEEVIKDGGEKMLPKCNYQKLSFLKNARSAKKGIGDFPKV